MVPPGDRPAMRRPQPLRVDERGFEENSRLAAVLHAAHVLRSVQRWRTVLPDGDHDHVMILLAVITISSERLLRSDLPPNGRRIESELPALLLASVNLASIAHATGLKRETVRRKVGRLVDEGYLMRAADGSISYRPGLLGEERVRDLLRAHIAGIARIATDLLRLGVLRA